MVLGRNNDDSLNHKDEYAIRGKLGHDVLDVRAIIAGVRQVAPADVDLLCHYYYITIGCSRGAKG